MDSDAIRAFDVIIEFEDGSHLRIPEVWAFHWDDVTDFLLSTKFEQGIKRIIGRNHGIVE
jgi:hypothetical protein